MNRIDRLHAILTHLQSKRKVTAQEIANRFNISLRTVYRDVKALDESGVPVIGEAGTGYTIMEGYRLPPVMFTQEEAVSLMLGAKLTAQFTDKSVQKQFESALFKIKSVLRNIDKEHVDQLNDSIAILAPKPGPDDGSAQYLAVLQKTIVDKKIVTIRYQANYSEEITERSIEPIGLCYYGSAWHLIAWCGMRKGYRDFRINRMKTLHVKEELFAGKNHPTLQHFINEMTNNHQTGLQEVTVLFSNKIIKHIGEQRYYHGFVSEEKVGEMYRMKFLTAHAEGLARWLLMYTDGVNLNESPLLLSLMKNLIKDLAKQHT
ncbi:MAG: helix-turn-helix transcriptional regulator [Chitinophagaceae bacterium]